MSDDNPPKMEAGPSGIKHSVPSLAPSVLSFTSIEEGGSGNVLHCTSSFIASHIRKVAPSIQCDNLRSSIDYPMKEAHRRNALLNINNDRQMTLVDGLNQAVNLEEEYDVDENELKLFPVSMQEKRETRRNAISFVLPKLTWKQKMTILINCTLQVIHKIFHYKLWDENLKIIEGRRGASIVSYFMFIRWLLFMNLVILLLNLIFVVLPHAASQTDIEAYNMRIVAYLEGENDNWTILKHTDIYEKISGDGNRTDLANNSKSSEIPSNKKNHHKRKIIENCSKNYAASLKMDNITFLESVQNFLQGTSNLFEFRQMREILQRTRMTRIKLYLIRFGVNVLIFAWTAGCYFLIIKTILYQMKKQINLRTSGINTMVLHYLPSIVMMVIRTPSMLMFNFLVFYEKYTSQMTVNISIYSVGKLMLVSSYIN